MNTRNVRSSIKIAGIAMLFALATGCASTAVEEAQADANEAQRIAQDAQRAAEEARNAAREALQAARSAQQAAEAAQQCCTDLEDKVDRAFEDLQRK